MPNLSQSCSDVENILFGIFDFSIAPNFLYYAYLPATIIFMLFGLYILFKDNYSTKGILFFLLTSVFSVLLLNEIIQWTVGPVRILQFSWQLIPFLKVMTAVVIIYFSYIFISKKHPPFYQQFILSFLVLSTVIFTPTNLNVAYFDFNNCEGVVGMLFNFVNIIGLLSALWVFAIMLKNYKNKNLSKNEIKASIFFSVGVISFLLIFFSTSFISELTMNWDVAFIGPIGMFLFLVFLSYTIVKFHTFNIKLIATQALIIAEIILVFSLIFSSGMHTSTRIIVGLTTVLVSIVGYLLVKSVKREIEQKEKLQHLTEKLEDANVKLQTLDKLKSEFISLASHQLRSPLTVIKGYASTLTDGIVGDLTDKQKEVAQHIYVSASGLANVVEDFLNVTKIEQGGMKYVFAPTDMRLIVNDLVSDMRITAEAKHLEFQSDINEGVFMVNADGTKMKQVFLNLIDNSIKYTKEGFVKVWLHKTKNEKGEEFMKFGVSDSGVGVSEETKAKLFQKFGRGEGAVMNGGGSGLGLYLAEEIVKEHGGEIIIDSEGLGKGSTFSVTLPLIKE